MKKEDFLKGEMPAFMREAHALITLQYMYDEDSRDEETKDRDYHELMDSFTDPHGVMMYLASYVAGDFPTMADWSNRLLEVEEVFRGQ